MKSRSSWWWIIFLTILPANLFGYLVGPAVPLDKLAGEADIIIKSTVVSLKPAENAWFQACPGYHVTAAELKVISTIKGYPLPETIRFMHYSANTEGMVAINYMPQNYNLTIGGTYILFANRTDQPGSFRQLWKSHTSKEDQGVFSCSSTAPVDTDLPLKQIVWKELTGHLASTVPQNILYSIRQLSDMSGLSSCWGTDLHDFDSSTVEDQIAPLMHHADHDVVMAAIRTLGAASPWLDDCHIISYLTKFHSENLPGINPVESKAGNPGAARYWRELIQVADFGDTPEIRSLAICALGHGGVNEVFSHIPNWLADPQEKVRGAATLLLADNHSTTSAHLLTRSADDPSTAVRRLAAFAIGCGRFDGLLSQLEGMLADRSLAVRTAVARSLLSFPLATCRAILERHVDDPQFQSVFIIALARENPKPWLDRLARVVEQNLMPSGSWSGQIPAYSSWIILYGFLVKQPADILQSGRYDHLLKALESPRFWISSEPCSLYALYLVKGLPVRAQVFRDHCKQTLPYDIDHYFKMVERDPKSYLSVP